MIPPNADKLYLYIIATYIHSQNNKIIIENMKYTTSRIYFK